VRGHHAAPDERGAVLVLVAVAAVLLFTVAAVVIDLGFVRETRQQDRSTSDFAVAAGLHGLESEVGVPRPWGGVCRAIEYLKANNSDLADMSGTWSDGQTPPTVYGTNPCVDPTADPYTRLCAAADRSTWARFQGTADGGHVTIDIRSGYVLPDPDFDEDATAYSGDVGDTALGGCDQLAVILRTDNDETFASVFGGGDKTTTIRSVGRVTIESDDTEAVALLLLEQTACRTLHTSGNNTFVRVRATPIGAPTRPGLIQANSTGTGCSGGQRVIEGSNDCPAISNCVGTGPSIVAENVPAGAPGRVGNRAVSTNPAYANTAACADAASPSTGCTIAPVPSDRGVVSRAPVDNRYLARVTALQTTANTELGRSNGSATTAGYFVITNCNSLVNKVVSATLPAGPTVINTGGRSRVFVDCDLGLNNGQTTAFDATIDDVVVDGSVSVSGQLELHDVRRFYVEDDIDVNGGALVVNSTSGVSCTARHAAAPASVTQLVVTDGPLSVGSNGTLRLCSTFVFLADGALPTSAGTAPSNNSYTSRIDVGAQATVDWVAPNQTDGQLQSDDPLYDQFEDLALWTEYSGNCTPGNAPRIGGQGAITATGVFFLPNACPFTIAGGGAGAVINTDAQFIARRLELTGTVALTMAPNPNNVVPTPVFEDFLLVR
jgi:hypothetical protein